MRAAIVSALILFSTLPQAASAQKNTVWKPVQFAVVRFNGQAPQSWNIYHAEKRDALLVKLWKRYLTTNIEFIWLAGQEIVARRLGRPPATQGHK